MFIRQRDRHKAKNRFDYAYLSMHAYYSPPPFPSLCLYLCERLKLDELRIALLDKGERVEL